MHSAAQRLERTYRAKLRLNQRDVSDPAASGSRHSWQPAQAEIVPPSNPFALELPGDAEYHTDRPGTHHSRAQSYQHSVTADDKFVVLPDSAMPSRPTDNHHLLSPTMPVSPRLSMDQVSYNGSFDSAARPSFELPTRNSPPPLPPKTPLKEQGRTFAFPDHEQNASSRQQLRAMLSEGTGPQFPRTRGTLSRPPAGITLPYPSEDEPPPPVNMARKPEYGMR